MDTQEGQPSAVKENCQMADEEFNLEDRILCSDGACIGVVGEDGNCKICGRAYEGDIPRSTNSADPILPTAESPGASIDEKPPETDLLTGENSAERVCCSDDMCVGIIGNDGMCGTCGKPYSPLGGEKS